MSGRTDSGAFWGAIVAAIITAYATITVASRSNNGPDPSPQPAPPAAPASAAAGPAAPAPPPAPPPAPERPAAPAASVVIGNVWLEHNVMFQGQNGMRIHVAFTAHYLAGTSLEVSAGFSDAKGTILWDTNGMYRFPDGSVGVGSNAVPNYESTVFNDFVLYLPYAELHLPPGAYELSAKVGIAPVGATSLLAVSYPVPFTFRS